MVSLKLISHLFSSVCANRVSKTEELLCVSLTLSKFGYTNVKNSKNISLLHYAAWKGHEDIVDILLRYKANPNAMNNANFLGKTKSGGSPLHYAAKYSHIKILKSLLSYGAIFDAVCDSEKTPLDYATDLKISNFLCKLKILFIKIRKGQAVFRMLTDIKDLETRKSVVRARNTDGRSLIALAVVTNHPEAKLLKTRLWTDVSTSLKKAGALFNSRRFEESIKLYEEVLEKRIDLFGPDDPGVLDTQIQLSRVFSSKEKFSEALNLVETVYKTQREIFGDCNTETLITKTRLALLLKEKGQSKEAINMLEEVLDVQIEVLGLNHCDTINTQIALANVLSEDGKLQASFDLCMQVLEIEKKYTFDPELLLVVKKGIAIILMKLGKRREALEMLQMVYERRKETLGRLNPQTIDALELIAKTLALMDNLDDALKTFKTVLKFQHRIFGLNHIKSMLTYISIGDILCMKKQFHEALAIYKVVLDTRGMIFEADDPKIQIIEKSVNYIVSHRKNQLAQQNILDACEMYLRKLKEIF